MLRKSRSIAHLLRHLLFGAASVAVVSTSAMMLVGCDDESQPEYWVGQLEKPAKRAAAVKRLTQFYEDGLTKSNQNREAPEMKALLAKIVGPMTQAYLKGADLDEKTRVELLKSLANTRDPAAKEAIILAMKNFAEGKATAEEMTQAALYVKALKLNEKDVTGPLLDAFLKIKVSDKELGPPFVATRDAMMLVPDPAWKTKLIELLARPIPAINPQQPDPKALAEAKNEDYWQNVAAAVLGELKADEAIKPLFKVVVTPEKKTVAGTAVVALIKIGKPAVPPLLDVLMGKDAEIAEIAKKSGPNAAVQNAAIVLGTIGRGEARDPMIAALNMTDQDEVRAILGREMSKLPTSPEAIKALETAFEKISIEALVGQGDPARIIVAEAAEKFMDPSIVPWALKQVTVLKSAKGEKETIDNIQVALLQTAMKVMKKDQVEEVKKAVDAEGDELTKKAFTLAADVVNACAENVGCYLAKLEEPSVQEKNNQFAGIKAAYMLGMLGNDATKSEIVQRLPKIKNDGVRATAIQAIDHLSPNGDNKVADELQKYVDEKEARGDKGPTDNVTKQVASRLRARAS